MGDPSLGECMIDGCTDERRIREMCRRHYQAWYRTGLATRQNRQPRLSHIEVATRARADTILRLFVAKILPRSDARLIAEAVGITEDDLRDALTRLHPPPSPPFATKRGHNRQAPPGKKWCPSCESFRLLSDFNRNRTTSDRLQGECGPCQRERQRRPPRTHRDPNLPS